MNIVVKPFEVVLGLGNEIKKSTPAMDGTCKVAKIAVNIYQSVSEVSSPVLSNVAKQVGAFSNLVGGLNFVDRLYNWTVLAGSEEKRKKMSPPKYISDASLTVSHGLEFTNLLFQVGILEDIWGLTAPMLPGVNLLETLKNGFYVPASVCGIWHSFIEMSRQDTKVAGLEDKVAKWTTRTQDATIDRDDFLNRIALPKIHALGTELQDLVDKRAIAKGNKLSTEDEAKFSKLGNRFRRWTSYSNELTNLGASVSLQNDCALKINGYNANCNIEKANSGKVKTKEWLGIANNIGKFIFGVLGLIATFSLMLGITCFACSAFALTLSVGWIATHTLNIAKNIYEGREANKILSYQKPHLAAMV